MSKLYSRLAVASLLLCLTAALTVFMLHRSEATSGNRHGQTHAEPKPDPQADAPSALQVLRDRYALFRSSPELPPVAIRNAISSEQRRTQRLVLSNPQSVWAFPSGQSVCLVTQDDPHGPVGSACSSLKRVIHRGIFIATISGASEERVNRLVVGLAPDWVSTVAIRTPGYGEARVRVVESVFVLRDTSSVPPETLSLTPRGRTVRTCAGTASPGRCRRSV